MVIQYKDTLQIQYKIQLFNYNIKCIKDKKNIEGYCYQMYQLHVLVYNTSNQVCHNCILIIHGFSRVCTIVFQLLHNLPINPSV